MLESLNIEGFRGLPNLAFERLSHVNLITGFNNAGKTSVLEALYFLFATHGQLVAFPSLFRNGQSDPGEQFEHFWRWLLPGGDLASEASVYANLDDKRRLRAIIKAAVKQSNVLSIQFVDSSRNSVNTSVSKSGMAALNSRPWPVMQVFAPRSQTLTADAELFNQLQLRSSGEDRLLELLSVIEPRLKKLRYAKITKQPLIYCDIGLSTLIPASQMGQAFCRLLTLYMEILVSGAQVLIVDEIENGLHMDVMDAVWRGLAGLCRAENVQVFVTTHSKECVRAAAKAADWGDDHGFSHHRLEKYQGNLVLNSTPEILGRTIPASIAPSET